MGWVARDMFTGIVVGVGRVLRKDDTAGDQRIQIDTQGVALPDVGRGDSIAVNGVCLTVSDYDANAFEADVSKETLLVTTLGKLEVGAPVNLEPSLRLGDSLDGHIVSGHVDGVGHVVALKEMARSHAITIETPQSLTPYFARKGSVTIDGVNLTINSAVKKNLEVNIIPHTREVTIIDSYEVGAVVNIEVDIIARYVERLFKASREAEEK